MNKKQIITLLEKLELEAQAGRYTAINEGDAFDENYFDGKRDAVWDMMNLVNGLGQPS